MFGYHGVRSCPDGIYRYIPRYTKSSSLVQVVVIPDAGVPISGKSPTSPSSVCQDSEGQTQRGNLIPACVLGQLSCQICTIPRFTLKLLNHQTVIQICKRESHSFISFTPRFAFSMLNAKLPGPLWGRPALSGTLILQKFVGLNHCITKK